MRLAFRRCRREGRVAQIDQFDGCTLLLSTGESDAQSHAREPVRSQAAAESEDAAKESDALGGSVRNQMRNEISPQKRYFGSFAGMSWISHGSVLALREISRTVDSAGPDLLHRAADDGNGNDWLHHAGWIVLKLVGSIQEHFKFSLQGV